MASGHGENAPRDRYSGAAHHSESVFAGSWLLPPWDILERHVTHDMVTWQGTGGFSVDGFAGVGGTDRSGVPLSPPWRGPTPRSTSAIPRSGFSPQIFRSSLGHPVDHCQSKSSRAGPETSAPHR